MAANTTMINLQSTASYPVPRRGLPRAAGKMMAALGVGALASFSVLEAMAVSQGVLGFVFNGALALLSRPTLPVSF